MSDLFYINNILPKTINFNGAAVNSVYFNNNLVWEKEINEEIPGALLFTSSDSFSIKPGYYGSLYARENQAVWEGKLEYSTDNGITWNEVIKDITNQDGYIQAGLVDDKWVLCFRGTDNIRLSLYKGSWDIVGSSIIKIIGYMASLIDYESHLAGELLNAGALSYMFYGCKAIIDASKLKLFPVNQIMSGCFESMFEGCSNLIKPPSVIGDSETTMIDKACFYMFRDCISLNSLPKLPARVLYESCYESMFYGCSLIKISETRTEECKNEFRIPSIDTTITYKSNSLSYMFSGITIKPNTTYYTNAAVI